MYFFIQLLALHGFVLIASHSLFFIHKQQLTFQKYYFFTVCYFQQKFSHQSYISPPTFWLLGPVSSHLTFNTQYQNSLHNYVISLSV